MPEHASKKGLSLTLLEQILSSAIAGIVGRICTHPLDTMKAVMQAPESRYCTIPEVWRQSSWRSLYRGLSVALVGGTPGTILYLTSYEQLKGDSTSFSIHFMAGMTAEALACSIYVPVDVIKERLQVGMYKTPTMALSTIFANDGAILTLYRGYWATLASFGPYSAFYFLLYEESKRLVRKYHQCNQLSFWWILACSAGSGATASFITSPLDLVKLRLQLKDKGKVRDGMWNELTQVYRSSGLQGLFRGAGARVLHFVPATTIAMTTYETCRGAFFAGRHELHT
jgi:Mitochondrial carrier protein